MDYGFYNWMDKFWRYGRPNKRELMMMALAIAIMTFILGFEDGNDGFTTTAYATNMLISLIAVTVAVFVHELAHRLSATYLGYTIEFKPVFFGLVGGLILTFMSSGKVVFLAYSNYRIKALETHRLGYFRHMLGLYDNGKIAVTGPLANLATAMVFRGIGTMVLPEVLVSKIVFVNVLFAIINILPIPPLDGAHVMYATKTVYPFVMGAVIAAAVLLLLPAVAWWMAVVAALIFGLAFAIFYFRVIEEKMTNW